MATQALDDSRYTVVCPRCGKLLFRSTMVQNMTTKCSTCRSTLMISVDGKHLSVAFMDKTESPGQAAS